MPLFNNPAKPTRDASAEPTFINNLNVAVQVFDPNKRQILVQPFANRKRHPDATFEVHGEHYRQFANIGQLTQFRPESVPEATAQQVRQSVAADQRRAAAEAARPPAGPVPPNVTAVRAPPPAHLGVPQQFTLDTLTAFAINRETADATPQQRSDVAAYILKRRAGDKNVKLDPSLMAYEAIANKIADDVDPADAPPEDLTAHPENAPEGAAGMPTVTADGVVTTATGEKRDPQQPVEAVRKADSTGTAPHGQGVSDAPTTAQKVEAANAGSVKPKPPTKK